jgi:hypothetical protein
MRVEIDEDEEYIWEPDSETEARLAHISEGLFGEDPLKDPVERLALAQEIIKEINAVEFQTLDVGMHRVLLSLWCFGIPTTFCCSGHSIAYLIAEDEGGFNLPHILFRFRDQGINELLYAELLWNLIDDFNRERPEERQLVLEVQDELWGEPLEITPPGDREDYSALVRVALGWDVEKFRGEPEWPYHEKWLAATQQEREKAFDEYINFSQSLFDDLAVFVEAECGFLTR